MVISPHIVLIGPKIYAPPLATLLRGLDAKVYLAEEVALVKDNNGLYVTAFEHMAEQAYISLGSVDAVVFCDRVHEPDSRLLDPDTIVEAATDATLRLLATVRCLVPRIIKSRVGGQFILVCDAIAVAGRVGHLSTATVGGAFIGMGKSIAKELGRHNLSVNILCHGLITGIDSGIFYTAETTMFKAMGMGKPSTLEHLAHNIAYLAKGEHWMNGQILHMSDGLIM